MSRFKDLDLLSKVKGLIRNKYKEIDTLRFDLENCLDFALAKYLDEVTENKEQFDKNVIRYSIENLEKQVIETNRIIGILRELRELS